MSNFNKYQKEKSENENEKTISNNIMKDEEKLNKEDKDQKLYTNKLSIINKQEKNKINSQINIIIANIQIEEENSKKRIINSYENKKREESNGLYFDGLKAIENEEQIMKS